LSHAIDTILRKKVDVECWRLLNNISKQQKKVGGRDRFLAGQEEVIKKIQKLIYNNNCEFFKDNHEHQDWCTILNENCGVIEKPDCVIRFAELKKPKLNKNWISLSEVKWKL